MLEERSQLPDDLLLRVANGEHIMSVLASAVEVGADGSIEVQKLLELLTTGVQGARRVIVEGAGHMVNMERPEEFNDLVLEFLKGR